MSKLSRRYFLKTTAGAAAIGALGAGHDLWAADSEGLTKWKPEKDATLRVLRWKRFVQGDEDQWIANTRQFTAKTGVPVRIDNEGWEDVRPKAAVAASVGSGPDLILGWYDDPHQYPHSLIDVSDVATYLGAKYGGWYDVCQKYGKNRGAWIAIPFGINSHALVYRDSHVKAAGFDGIPSNTADFLKLCRALRAKGTPAGFALGKAVGDGNCWAHWLLWSHGGKVFDQSGKVVLNSPEAVAALEYARELYPTFVPGTLSWLDPSNNKVFLDGQISLTGNGISIYYAARDSKDARLREMAKDIQHAHFPVGPVGRPTELMATTQMMLFKHCRYPNAAKAYLAFMMEGEQYNAWLQSSLGYTVHPLKAYEANPVWTADPQTLVFRDAARVILDHGHAGPLGYASAAVLADYIVLDMVAEAASGARSPKEAAERAHKRAERYAAL